MNYLASILFVFIFLAQPCGAIENIVGFDLGGELKNYEELKELDLKKLSAHVYVVPEVKFFDSAQIETDENHIIKGIGFRKTYIATTSSISVEKRTIHKDFNTFVENLSKRYGEFDITNANGILGVLGNSNSFYMSKIHEVAVNRNPKSTDIGSIIINLESPEVPSFVLGGEKPFTLTLLYIDKELTKKLAKMRDEETAGF